MIGWIEEVFGIGEVARRELYGERLSPSELKAAAEVIRRDVLAIQARLCREREELERRRREEEAQKRAEQEKTNSKVNEVRFSLKNVHDNIRYSVSSMLAPDYNSHPPFGILLARLVKDKYGDKASTCYKRAGISKQTYSRIISNPFSGVNKMTAMQLCIGLRLSYQEAVRLLASAGYTFSEAILGDRVFAYCLQNSVYNIFDVKEMLNSCGARDE